MFKSDRGSVWLGLLAAAFALILILVWVPFDVDTSYFETRRRKLVVGDSLAPTVAGAVILLGALMTMLRAGSESRLSGAHLRFLGIFLLLVAVSFALMRWTGPALGALLTDTGYRPLRDTMPWKIVGFLTGGTVLVAGLIAFAERRISWKAVAIGVLASLLLVAVYDLHFDDLLLPPNGDV